MKRYLYSFLTAALFCVMASSCKKVINLDLGSAAPQMVIEGNITNVFGPQIIKLSQTVPFSNINVYPAISGATVNVTDNFGNSYTFTEGPAGTYSSARFMGVAGTVYTMNVTYGGKTYLASSTMPQPVRLDSLTAKNSVFDGANSKDVTAYYQDPANVANQYNFLMYVNSVQVNRIFAFDDEFTDGRYTANDLFQNDITIKSGDTVKITMQCIDKNIYIYWYSLMQQQVQGPGGGTTPSNPPSNINNNALGYFSAHSTQSMRLLIP